ncbi:MAG TPA: hypothetical protein DCZ41_05860 [Firmicutes bacterium]|nr:hypothetical protein [Bacillota bacterium]
MPLPLSPLNKPFPQNKNDLVSWRGFSFLENKAFDGLMISNKARLIRSNLKAFSPKKEQPSLPSYLEERFGVLDRGSKTYS